MSSIQIDVSASETASPGRFEVSIQEGASSSTHTVGVPEDFYQKLTQGKISKAACVKAAFCFLLEREPKETILRTFDLPVISRYFPEFEQEFPNYL